MPIWLRKFTVNKIVEFRQEEKNEIEKAKTGNNSTSAKMGDPIPDHIKNTFKKASKQADYISKQSKK